MYAVLVFLGLAGALLAADMYAHRKNDAPITLGGAVFWTLAYVMAALAFAGFLTFDRGSGAASLFLAGFVMEKALSIDNLMVFVAIFTFFKIPGASQHKVLHYGIMGAVVFRLIFVAIGAGALHLFGPTIGIIFGLFVIWSGYQMLKDGGGDVEDVDYANQWYIRWARRYLPFTNDTSHGTFFARGPFSGDLMGTPLLMALVAIEVSDVLFAFDSVPAVIAVTRDPLLIYTAMIFAILGLRQLYFVLTALLRYLVHLDKAVIAVLFFIGVKMLAQSLNEFGFFLPEISPNVSLAIVLGTLVAGVIASFIWPEPADGTLNG